MATRANLTVDDVLPEFDEDEIYSDSNDDDFDCYVDMRERENDNSVDEPVEVMDVGANVKVGSESSSESDSLPEYTCQPGCTIPEGGNNRPTHYFSHLMKDVILEHNCYSDKSLCTAVH